MGYYEIPALSNSGMGLLNPNQSGSPKRFKQVDKVDDKYSLALDRGSLLHLAILEPEKFITQDVDRPTGLMGTFVEYYRILLQTHKQTVGSILLPGMPEHHLLVTKACELCGYKLSPVTVWSNYCKDPRNEEYLDYLHKVEPGMLPVSRETRNILDACLSNLRTHPLANNLLFEDDDMISTWNELEIFWVEQITIYGEYGEEIEVSVPCKAKVDRLRYHSGTQRFQNVDLKTTGQGLGKFPDSYVNYRYYRQNAFYDLAIKHFANQHNIIHAGCTHLNVAVETTGLSEVGVFKSQPEWIAKGRAEYAGILQRYAWHTYYNKWEYPMEYYLTGGLLTLPLP